MPRSFSGRRRPALRAPQRRRRSWARHHGEATLEAGIPTASNLLADYRTEAGISAGPVGITIGGGWLQWCFLPASEVTDIESIRVGIIVVDENMAGDVPSPSGDEHVDWMYITEAYITPPQRAVIFDGTNGPQVRWKAARRMDELGMNLFFVAEATVGGDIQFFASTVLINP